MFASLFKCGGGGGSELQQRRGCSREQQRLQWACCLLNACKPECVGLGLELPDPGLPLHQSAVNTLRGHSLDLAADRACPNGMHIALTRCPAVQRR